MLMNEGVWYRRRRRRPLWRKVLERIGLRKQKPRRRLVVRLHAAGQRTRCEDVPAVPMLPRRPGETDLELAVRDMEVVVARVKVLAKLAKTA